MQPPTKEPTACKLEGKLKDQSRGQRIRRSGKGGRRAQTVIKVPGVQTKSDVQHPILYVFITMFITLISIIKCIVICTVDETGNLNVARSL